MCADLETKVIGGIALVIIVLYFSVRKELGKHTNTFLKYMECPMTVPNLFKFCSAIL